MLVIDQALNSDQGNKYVYVLDKDKKAQYRKVATGPLQPDGLRVIEPPDPAHPEEGLHPDDWVIVGGLPQVKPQMKIVPDEQPMPTLAGKTLPDSPGASGGGPAGGADSQTTGAKGSGKAH
jgi:multidrug efflux system membrane fusion protein